MGRGRGGASKAGGGTTAHHHAAAASAAPAVPAKAASRATPERAAKAAKLKATRAAGATVSARTVTLHNTAHQSHVTVAHINELHPQLAKLSKPQLHGIAKKIGLVGLKNKSRPAISKGIVDRIRSIKQSAMRVEIAGDF